MAEIWGIFVTHLGQGCVDTFDTCVLPLIPEAERRSCGMNVDSNDEYGDWATACRPRGRDLLLPVVG